MFCILRTKKRKRAALSGLSKENNRTQSDHTKGKDFYNSKIDWERTGDNIFLVKSEDWNASVTEQLDRFSVKERKNSVVILDSVFTASPEWFETHSKSEAADYFKDCLSFYIHTFCEDDKTRIINAVIHLDESTPHLHIQSIPIHTDEKGFHLSAKTIMGNRIDYSNRQTDFFTSCGLSRGMERGKILPEDETKEHTEQREFHKKEMQKEIDKLKSELSIRQLAYEAYQTHDTPPEIISRTEEKKVLGKVHPATVTISESDFDRLESMRKSRQGIDNALSAMNAAAKKADIDSRVRTSEQEAKAAQEQVQALQTKCSIYQQQVDKMKQALKEAKEYFNRVLEAIEMFAPGIVRSAIEYLQQLDERQRAEREIDDRII